jgi:ABC-type lipoprotein release transport system permease subunit
VSVLRLLRTAWRNLWRDGRRTAITLAAITFSTAVLVITRALMHGLVQDAIRNATNVTVGEVQLHAPGYLRDQSFYRAIPDPAAVLAGARRRAVGAAARSYGYGLVAHGTKSAGALFWGVEPARERAAFDLPRHVAEGAGTFLGDAPARGVVLGRKLARSLDVGVGAELVVVVQAADGSLGAELYTVTGVLKTVGEAVDRSAAILHRADFEALFVSGGRVHEIAFNSRGALPLAELEAVVAALAPAQEVHTWRQLLPVLSDMLAMMDVWIWIFGAIFLLAAGLGVMNTMLMATHERIREFGILKALGASPWRIARDVAVEALVLALIATALGVALGAAGSLALERHGIDTTAFAGETSIGGVAFNPVWRAALEVSALPAPMIIMWVTCVLASLYPAILAARLEPVQAMQHV